jgi:transcriptional regulator with XRE-family HTH domain
MDYSLIGKKIKELRKMNGLSQGELAEGICTQALISQIEKGMTCPSAEALYEISNKLGVDINYFFEVGASPRMDYLQEVEHQLKRIRRKAQYKEIRDIVKIEEKNPLFQMELANMQLLLWHKGIYQYEIEKNPEKAQETLEEAFNLTTKLKKALSERELEILLTIGTIHASEGHLQEALDLYSRIETILMDNRELSDKAIKTRLLYNIARVKSKIGEYEESIRYCTEAIKWCLDEEHMYLLGELHYHIGYNYELQGNYSQAIHYIDQALMMFDIQCSAKYNAFLERKREEFVKKNLTELQN